MQTVNLQPTLELTGTPPVGSGAVVVPLPRHMKAAWQEIMEHLECCRDNPKVDTSPELRAAFAEVLRQVRRLRKQNKRHNDGAEARDL